MTVSVRVPHDGRERSDEPSAPTTAREPEPALQPRGRRFSRGRRRTRRAHVREGDPRRLRARPLPRVRAHRARPAGAPLARDAADAHRARRQARLLPVVRVPDRAQPRPVPDEHGPVRGGASSSPRSRGFDLGEVLECEGDPGPRQRRPGPAGGLLHGLAGDARAARDRLRHPLRLRHVRAAHRARPPGRAARQLAAAAATPGSCRATRTRRPCTSYGRVELQHGRATAGCASHWVDTRARDRAALRLVHRRPPHRHRRTRCGCGRRAPRATSTCSSSTRATTAARSRRRSTPRTSPRSSTRTTTATRARSCGSSSSTSSSPARSRTSCGASSRGTATSTLLPGQGRDPAQRHPPGDRRRRADARAGRRGGARLGRGLGDHRSDRSRYTNHTLMPEALERWPVALFERLLPRHLQIIYEINQRFLRQVQHALAGRRRAAGAHVDHRGGRRQAGPHGAPGDRRRAQHQRRRQAAHASWSRRDLLPDFYELWPERFNNKTNGVTPRRWLLHANPRADPPAHRARIGSSWIDLPELSRLQRADRVRRRRGPARRAARGQAGEQARRSPTLIAQPHRRRRLTADAMFVVQVKRIHEYKRQLLACLQIVAHYLALKRDPDAATCRAPTSSRARPRPATRWPSCTSA